VGFDGIDLLDGSCAFLRRLVFLVEAGTVCEKRWSGNGPAQSVLVLRADLAQVAELAAADRVVFAPDRDALVQRQLLHLAVR